MKSTFVDMLLPGNVPELVVGTAGGAVIGRGIGLAATQLPRVVPILGADVGYSLSKGLTLATDEITYTLQSPVYLDLQQGAVAYSGIPIGTRSLLRPTELAPIYEQQIRNLYGSATLAQRQFRVLGDDGRLALRTADNVAIIGGEDVAIEAKFISDFSISPYNPNSFAGKFQKNGMTEFERAMRQATTYSDNFASVIYHTNSRNFIDFYRPVFEQQSLSNTQFVLTPLKPL